MKKLKFLAALFAAAVVFNSCTDKGIAVADGKLSYSFHASNLNASLSSTAAASGAVVAEGTNGSINWSAASVNIAKIEFSAKHAGNAISLESKNIYGINPLSADSLAGTIGIQSGTYENIEVKLGLAPSANLVPIQLTGTYIEGSGTRIPVVLQMNQALDIKLQYDKINVDAATYVGKVTIELNKLVKNLTASDFGQTTRTSPNNAIVVSSTSNTTLFAKLALNLPGAMSVSFSKK